MKLVATLPWTLMRKIGRHQKEVEVKHIEPNKASRRLGGNSLRELLVGEPRARKRLIPSIQMMRLIY